MVAYGRLADCIVNLAYCHFKKRLKTLALLNNARYPETLHFTTNFTIKFIPLIGLSIRSFKKTSSHKIQVLWCLLPMNFQAFSNTFQNHKPQAVHQSGKFLGNKAELLSFTGFLWRHVDDLRLGINTGPASSEFYDHMILHHFCFILWDLVPFVAHKQGTFRGQFTVPLKRNFSNFL